MTAIVSLKQRTSPSCQSAPHVEVPVSARICARLLQAKQRFHANDNIAPFIEAGEMDELQQEVEGKARARTLTASGKASYDLGCFFVTTESILAPSRDIVAYDFEEKCP